MSTETKTLLTVPFEKKNDAKFNGCQWSQSKKTWFIHKLNPHHDAMVKKYPYKVECKVYMMVPYDERAEAKALGAKFDKESKLWYLPYGKVKGCERWLSTEEYEADSEPVTQETVSIPKRKKAVKTAK